MIDLYNKYGKSLIGKDMDSYEYRICKIEIPKLFEKHLKNNNPDEVFKEYIGYFAKKEYKKRVINIGEIFYRGRIGKLVVPGAIDDCNTNFTMPFYKSLIAAPPAIYTSGGRFNRGGVSYLYLATDVETCLAEVHLQVGQECSVAKFECIENLELLDLSNYGSDLELKIWYDIITQPIHNEIKYKYFMTQFLSEVLMKLSSDGLYFKSTQSSGDNIVSFKSSNFQLVEYSEKIYEARKIKYEFVEVEDTIRKFAVRDDTHLINDLNTDLVEKNERQIEYLEEWIEHEKENR